MPESFLLTGATGFLGRHIREWLQEQRQTVTSLGRDATNNVICDLAAAVPQISQPVNVVVHAAGKAHMVPRTSAERQVFFDVNLTGTRNLCRGLEQLPVLPEAFLFISTVAVYGREEGTGITEQHPLQGNTPYALSKIEAEQFLRTWCQHHQVQLSILRLPLVAGSNPPGNLGTMIRGIRTGRYFNIGGGAAHKSMVMAADVAAAVPLVAATGGTYNLTDGRHPSFAQLAARMAGQLRKPLPKNMPLWLASPLALAGNLLGNRAPINTGKLRKITATLTFDDQLARHQFGWQPRPVLEALSVQ